MFWFPTKKQIKKELKKISNSFKERDNKIKTNSIRNLQNSNKINQLSNQTESNKLKIARLEGAISVLLNKSQVPISQSVKKSQSNIETKIINRVRRSKKALVMAEINKLSPSMSVIEMYEDIVLSKGLCSKASFYRYIQSLKSQDLLRLRQK